MNKLPISAYSSLLKFDMKMFVNIERLDIGKRKAGVSVYFGNMFSVCVLNKINSSVVAFHTEKVCLAYFS